MKDIGIFEGDRAKNYDQFIQDWMPNYDSLLACLPQLLEWEAATGQQKVLAVGSGTGNELLTLARARTNWQFLGIDPSPEMMLQAQQKLATFPNVQLQEGYVQQLSNDEPFQAATLLLVLHFLPDDGSKLNLLKGIADRLERNAPFVLADIFGAKEELIQNLVVLKSLFPPAFLSEDTEERLSRIRDHIHYLPEPRLVELLEAAGFQPPTRFFQIAIWGAWCSRKR